MSSVVDASVIIGTLHTEDMYYEASRRWLRKHLLSEQPLVAPAILLAEVAGALARRTNNPLRGRQAAQYLLALPDLEVVPIDTMLTGLTAQLAADLRLRGADAFYVAVAALRGLPLITWDREQRERSMARIVARRPDEV